MFCLVGYVINNSANDSEKSADCHQCNQTLWRHILKSYTPPRELCILTSLFRNTDARQNENEFITNLAAKNVGGK